MTTHRPWQDILLGPAAADVLLGHADQLATVVVSPERWAAIPGWEGLYEASTHGRIRSVDRLRVSKNGVTKHLKSHVLAQSQDAHGRCHVQLYRNGSRQPKTVHSLVMFAFVGPRPAGMEIAHWDGDAGNNHLENLRYATPGENEKDKVRHGTHRNASKTHCPQNHPYDEANTIRYPNRSGRQCRACRIARNERRRIVRVDERGAA